MLVIATCLSAAINGCCVDSARAGQPRLWPKSQLVSWLDRGRAQTVVVYGTSLSAGGAWVPQISAALDSAYPGQITWRNGALSGRASNTGVARLGERVLVHEPDAVFLEFAVNDAFEAYPMDHPDHGITPVDARSNLESMIQSIQTQHPGAEVILQTMNPAWDAPNGNGSGSKRPNLPDYYQVYRDVAAERGLLLVDNLPVWATLQTNDPAEFSQRVADGVHPDSDGYRRLVTPAILSTLGAETGMTLYVDIDTGQGVVENRSTGITTVIGYTLGSDSGALLVEWSSLADQGVAGWAEANPTAKNLSELNATRSTGLRAGGVLDLGAVWDNSAPLDLSFQFQTLDGSLHSGSVIYTTGLSVPLAGDFNRDGSVDTADYVVWRDGLGDRFTTADYHVWRENFGARVSPHAHSIPEPPASLLLFSASELLGVAPRGRR